MAETLRKERARDGLVINEKSHPEWGAWVLRRARTGWRVRGESGERVLLEEDFRFWQLGSPPQGSAKGDPTHEHLVAALALIDGLQDPQRVDPNEQLRALEYELRVAAERLRPDPENRRRLGALASGA